MIGTILDILEELKTLTFKDMVFQFLLTLYSFAAVANLKPWINWGYVLFLLWFYCFKEEIGLRSLWQQKLFRGTVFGYVFFLVSFLVPNVLNESWGGIVETNDYIHYMLPALFLVLILYKHHRKDGLLIGVLVAMFYVCLRADYAMLILKNFSEDYMWNRNFFAGWIIIMIPILMVLNISSGKSVIYKAFTYVAVFLGIFSLLICGCRGAAIAGLVMTVTGALCVKDMRIRKVLVAISVSMLVCSGVLYGFGYLQISHSDMSRIYLWQGGINMFMEHPWIGVGFDQWNYQFTRYFLPLGSFEFNIVTPHNIVLELLNKQGIVGCLGFTILLGAQFFCLQEYMRDGSRNQYYVAFIVAICSLGCIIHGMVDNVIFTHICMKAYCFLWGIAVIILMEENQFRGGRL